MSIASQFATRTRKVIAIGRNYAAHAAELNNAIPSEPFFFLKPPSSIIADGEPVECPRGVTLHHEVELGVVIGKAGREIKAEDAMSYVAGYTLGIDYTGRNLQNLAKSKSLPWTTAKGFDTWLPLSTPSFIPSALLPNPAAAHLSYAVNGTTRQAGSTALMLTPVPELIAFVSGIMRLEEGDLILTGTPEGVSQVVPGDKVEAELRNEESGEVLATLAHEIVAREGGYQFKA